MSLLETIEDAAELLGINSPPLIRARQAAEISAVNTKVKRLREQCHKVIVSSAEAGMYVAIATIEFGTSDETVNAQVAELEGLGYKVQVEGARIRIDWFGVNE